MRVAYDMWIYIIIKKRSVWITSLLIYTVRLLSKFEVTHIPMLYRILWYNSCLCSEKCIFSKSYQTLILSSVAYHCCMWTAHIWLIPIYVIHRLYKHIHISIRSSLFLSAMLSDTCSLQKHLEGLATSFHSILIWE